MTKILIELEPDELESLLSDAKQRNLTLSDLLAALIRAIIELKAVPVLLNEEDA
jgi:hypothetical protein